MMNVSTLTYSALILSTLCAISQQQPTDYLAKAVPCETSTTQDTIKDNLNIGSCEDNQECYRLTKGPSKCPCVLLIDFPNATTEIRIEKLSINYLMKTKNTTQTLTELNSEADKNGGEWFCSQVWGETFSSECRSPHEMFELSLRIICVCSVNCALIKNESNDGRTFSPPPLLRDVARIKTDGYLFSQCDSLDFCQVPENGSWFCYPSNQNCKPGKADMQNLESGGVDMIFSRVCCTDWNCRTMTLCSQMFNVRNCAMYMKKGDSGLVTFGCWSGIESTIKLELGPENNFCAYGTYGTICIGRENRRLMFPKEIVDYADLVLGIDHDDSPTKDAFLHCGHLTRGKYCFVRVELQESKIVVEHISRAKAFRLNIGLQYKVKKEMDFGNGEESRWRCIKPVRQVTQSTIQTLICACQFEADQPEESCHQNVLRSEIKNWNIYKSSFPFPISAHLIEVYQPKGLICAQFQNVVKVLWECPLVSTNLTTTTSTCIPLSASSDAITPNPNTTTKSTHTLASTEAPGLSTGHVIGIVFGCAVLLLCMAGLIIFARFLFCRRKKHSARSSSVCSAQNTRSCSRAHTARSTSHGHLVTAKRIPSSSGEASDITETTKSPETVNQTHKRMERPAYEHVTKSTAPNSPHKTKDRTAITDSEPEQKNMEPPTTTLPQK